MSQGGRLARCLQRINCPKAKDFTAESLEWLFENQACLPFLEWFCDNISSDNVLSDDELRRYKELVSSGQGILEGEKLTEALSCAKETEEEDRPVETLREEIESTEKTVELMNKRLQKLIFQRNKLSLHQTKCAHQLTQISEVEKDSKQKYKKNLEISQVDSNQMDLAISNLQHVVSDLTELYTNQDEQRNRKVFLSQLCYDEYFNSEEKFTSDLTLYTKRQFFEGIADMAGRGDKSRYDLLEISEPTSLLIRGESEEVTLNDCKELTRLQSVFALSESKRINAEATTMGVKSALSLAKEKDRAMLRHTITDVDNLRDHLNETQASLADIKDEILKLTDKTLPSMVEELAELQASKILRGDYNLKIARQDYFTSKQDQVINQLLLQRSRYEFLSMTLEVEAHKHRDTHRLFSAVECGLKHRLETLEKRISKMSDPNLHPLDSSRNTIDSRDVFLGRLYKMLELSDPSINSRDQEGQLFLTYQQLLDWSSRIVGRVQGLQRTLETAEHQQQNTLRKLEVNLQQCQKAVYGGSTTADGLPQLTPQRLADSLVQLEEVLSTLEQSIKDIIKDVEGKKKVLRSDNLKAMKRDLYVCFFTDTSRLRRAIAELAARVDAQIVSTQ